MSNGIDPRVICCATGACCDGLSEKVEALATILEHEMLGEFEDMTAGGHAHRAAQVVLRYFTLADKKGRKTKADFGVQE